MLQKLKSLIKRCITVSEPREINQTQMVDIRYMGRKATPSQVIHDYGFYSSAPTNSIGLCMSVRGEEDDRVSFVYSPLYYGKPLLQNEVILGNFVKDATLKFDVEGNAILIVPGDVIVQCRHSSITCDTTSVIASGHASLNCMSSTLTSGATCQINAGEEISLNAPTISLNGVAAAPQSLSVTGGLTSEGIEVSKSNHKHDPGTYLDSVGGAVTGKSSADAGS